MHYSCTRMLTVGVKGLIEESLGAGKTTLHRAVSLRQHGFLVC